MLFCRLETELRLGLHGHERGNPGYRQDIDLTDHRASPRPYQALNASPTAAARYGCFGPSEAFIRSSP